MTAPGTKLDAGKAPIRKGLLEQFPRACEAIARVSAFGAAKYAWNGWEAVENGIERYGNAGARHILDQAKHGIFSLDGESGELHAAHEAWNAVCRLELILREMEKAHGAAGEPDCVSHETVRFHLTENASNR